MKKVSESNYRNAFAVLYGEWIRVNTVESFTDDESIILPARIIDPETAVIKSEAYENLSHEAKEIIDTILNGPMEILEMFSSPIEKKVNARRVLKYYRDLWCSPLIAKSFIDEIKKWASGLK